MDVWKALKDGEKNSKSHLQSILYTFKIVSVVCFAQKRIQVNLHCQMDPEEIGPSADHSIILLMQCAVTLVSCWLRLLVS